MNKCYRCGMPFSELDAPMAHKNCDESFDDETWTISPEELAARAERAREYQKKIQSGVKNGNNKIS